MRFYDNGGTISKAYILHENKEWIKPLIAALDKYHIAYEEWFIHEGQLDLNTTPPAGVFYNRMSASSHTRGHRYAIELADPILSWLEFYDRRVINSSRALQLEIRKIEQYLSLRQFGLETPHTIATVGSSEILQAAKTFGGKPFIIKPNRGGKGLGVQLFHSVKDLQDYSKMTSLQELSLDGVVLIQEYIPPKDKFIVRMEFIGGRFYYAVRVDTSDGFELCPADECVIDNKVTPTKLSAKPPRFKILEGIDIPEISQCEAFLEANNIEIAGIEYVENDQGERFIYDVNTNTNYNDEAEANSKSGYRGMERIAEFLSAELLKVDYA